MKLSCRSWRPPPPSRASVELDTIPRAAVDERGLVVAGGFDEADERARLCRVLISGRWIESYSTPFCGELVLLDHECDECVSDVPSCCRLAYSIEASAQRTLEWASHERIWHTV